MIHPATELRFVNPSVGYGVFATAPIPRGTVVYVQDELEIVLTPGHPLLEKAAYRPILDRYCIINPDGTRVLSWDIARFVNHSCRPNTLSTGYGFEIAVRDIAAGEQLTDDYGLFNLPYTMPCLCGETDCRGAVDPAAFADLTPVWDAAVTGALADFAAVPQPLLPFLDAALFTAVTADLALRGPRSVAALRPGMPAV